MKKSLPIALALLVAASLSAAPVLIEAYNEETTMSSPGDTTMVVELSFSVDTSCYTLFTAGGIAMQAKMFLQLNGKNLFPASIVRGAATYSTHITYTYPLGQREHTVRFMITDNASSTTAVCLNAYLQALIFLPDEPDAVAEQPSGNTPQPQTHSVVSQGPWVSAPGATELYDSNGRKVSTVPQDGRISLQELPAGTYFAQEGASTILKIMKVQ